MHRAGGFCTGFISPGKIRGGGGFHHHWKPRSSNHLTHTLTCKPMLDSESERVTNQIATESSISSQYLKESAVPKKCPKTMDPENAVAPGEIFANSRKDENFPRNYTCPKHPLPLYMRATIPQLTAHTQTSVMLKYLTLPVTTLLNTNTSLINNGGFLVLRTTLSRISPLKSP